jgi:hypothetical protein
VGECLVYRESQRAGYEERPGIEKECPVSNGNANLTQSRHTQVFPHQQTIAIISATSCTADAKEP